MSSFEDSELPVPARTAHRSCRAYDKEKRGRQQCRRAPDCIRTSGESQPLPELKAVVGFPRLPGRRWLPHSGPAAKRKPAAAFLSASSQGRHSKVRGQTPVQWQPLVVLRVAGPHARRLPPEAPRAGVAWPTTTNSFGGSRPAGTVTFRGPFRTLDDEVVLPGRLFSSGRIAPVRRCPMCEQRVGR